MNVFYARISGQLGEIWLDKNLKYVGWVDANDAAFSHEYHGAMFRAAGVNAIGVYIMPTDEQLNAVDAEDDFDGKTIFKIFQEDILKAIKIRQEKPKK